MFRNVNVDSPQERNVVIGEGAFDVSSFCRFAAFTMIEVHGKVLTRVSIQAAIGALAAIYKKFMVAHNPVVVSPRLRITIQ